MSKTDKKQQQIQIIQTTPQELENLINERMQVINDNVQTTLKEFLKHFQHLQPKEYISRKDVTKMFGVNIGTVNNWSKEGILNPLSMGGRVYFLRSDIEKALNKNTSS